MPLALDKIVRSGVKIANDLTVKVQSTVQHLAWIGRNPEYDDPVELKCIIEWKNEAKIQVGTGAIIQTKAKLTFLSPVTPNGVSGRKEPFDERDKIIMPDGTRAPVRILEGLVDPSISSPFVPEVYIGV